MRASRSGASWCEERNLVTIPNDQLSSEKIANLSVRDRFLLDWGDRVDRQRRRRIGCGRVLASIRQLLDGDENVAEGVRGRFFGFDASLIDNEMFAYIRTHDYAIFLDIREAALLMDATAAKMQASRS